MKKNVRSSVYVSAEIDPIEVLDELNDDEREIVARSWGYVPEGEDAKEEAVTAINQIRVGKLDDAIVTLERAFLPRWGDVADCEQQYKLEMGEPA